MDDKTLKALASQYGTPCFVFDTDALAARVNAIRAILGGKISLCYSIKANPFLIKNMAALVDKIEVCSPGEFTICENVGLDMDKVVLSGVNKTADDVRRAASANVGIYTAESEKHLRLLDAEAERCGKTLPVLLRLTSGNQFGVDEAALRKIIAARAQYKSLDIVGIHYFAGTQRARLKEQEKELARLDALIDSLKAEHGFETKRLEYGPGLHVPYFEKEDFSDTLAPCTQLAPALKALAEKTQLTVEMGRFFTAECGYYLTAIDDIKQSGDTNYIIADGGINHLTYYGQTMAMKIPKMRHFAQNESTAGEKEKTYTICGSLCTIADVLVRSVPLKTAAEGDILVFENTGAYSVTEGMYLFLSRKMPKVILYGAQGARLVRDAFETDKLNIARE